MKKPVLVVSTGAGISAESGIKTFRDADGLWENYPVMQVASADGFRRDPELVHKFYNQRRRDLLKAVPNGAHKALVELEKDYDVYVITQNVDDLHERAGWTNPATRGRNGDLMRPHIVFFQEPVPNIEKAVDLVRRADIFVVIGTSLVVYPAAGLIQYVRPGTPIYYIDPNPASTAGIPGVHVIKEKATDGMKTLARMLYEKR